MLRRDWERILGTGLRDAPTAQGAASRGNGERSSRNAAVQHWMFTGAFVATLPSVPDGVATVPGGSPHEELDLGDEVFGVPLRA